MSDKQTRCPGGVWGHSPARHGEGCAGCDAEHARVFEKHVGSLRESPRSPAEMLRAAAAWLDIIETGTCCARADNDAEIRALRKVAELVLDANEADWKAKTDAEADMAWGEAIQAARKALESSREPKEGGNG